MMGFAALHPSYDRMRSSFNYRGRFAPSPTGPLHFGSLVAAVGSYLDAKHHQGKWLVRIEDLDTPRTVKGAADDILGTLETYGLHWDEEIIYQSQRTAAYEEAFHRLKESGALYPCSCTRKEIADSALHGIDGQIYPGTCRNGIPAAREARAWRARTNLQLPVRPEPVEGHAGFDKLSPNGFVIFDDALQGGHPDTVRVNDGGERGGPAAARAIGSVAATCRNRITQHLENEIGDFVVKRADGLFAYQLAVVVNDAFQGITHVVRGADLLYSTPRQIYLQRLLGLPAPAYMHLPVVVNAQGEKLSKQTLAQSVEKNNAASILFDVLMFLRQQPPAELRVGKVEEILAWAVANWWPDVLANFRQLAVK